MDAREQAIRELIDVAPEVVARSRPTGQCPYCGSILAVEPHSITCTWERFSMAAALARAERAGEEINRPDDS